MKVILSIYVALMALAIFQQEIFAYNILDCAGKNGDAKLVSLAIDSCPDNTAERCNFIRGQNATMSLLFEPTKTFSQANISIKANLHGIYIPFHLPGPKDACGHYGFDCPVKLGQKDNLKITIPVLRSYPKIKVAVHFEMTDENNKPILCLEFPVQLMN